MWTRKTLFWTLCLTCLVSIGSSLVSGCVTDGRVKSAEKSLRETAAELPSPSDSILLGETDIHSALDCGLAASREQSRTCCAYAESFRAYGTEMSSTLSLDLYVEQLEKLDWREVSRTDGSRFLARGKSETLDVATYPMCGWYVSELDPGNQRANYPTVLHFRLFIALPQRDGC